MSNNPTPTNPTPNLILDFWFADGMAEKWYGGGEKFDNEIRDKFADLYSKAAAGGLDKWQNTREGRLALVIICDQFSRNLYRGQGQAFGLDAKGLEIANYALRMGDDIYFKANKPDSWRAFLYMPFMHHENLESQRRCLDLFLTHGPETNVPFARQHLDVIYRFGRFPGRNLALGRPSTAEEQAFLETGAANW